MKISLPRFLKEHQGLPPYGAVCLKARTDGIPGIVPGHGGFGWIVENEQEALKALHGDKHAKEHALTRKKIEC